MPKRALILVFCLTLLFNFDSVYANSQKIVINAFCLRTTAKSTDEFIELYNAGEEQVFLKGWRLKKFTASGTGYNLLTSFPEIYLQPKEKLIVAHRDYSGVSNLYYSTTFSLAEDNSLILYYSDGKTEIDKVGWGRAKYFEGSALPNPKPDEIWERKEEGYDSDDNFEDFQIKKISDREEDNIELLVNEAETVGLSLYLTELMPNPKGSDSGNEWIEIYNAGPKVNLKGLVISDKFGSVRNYLIKTDLIVNQGQYYVFKLNGAGISLNNDGDMIEIKDAKGTLVASSGKNYGTAKEGLSWAFDGEDWHWTQKPTPGSQNIIELPTDSSAKGKTAKAKKVKAPKVKNPKAVKGLTINEEPFNQSEIEASEKDKKLGLLLIGFALIVGVVYIVYTNWSEIVDFYFKKRKSYQEFCQSVRQKFKRR